MVPLPHPCAPRLLPAVLIACATASPASGDTDPGTPEPEPVCTVDADCDDGNPCTGIESCEAGVCVPGEPVVCETEGESCLVEGGAAVCGVLCALPMAPVLSVIDDDEVLVFTGPEGIETAVVAPGVEPANDDWTPSDIVPLDTVSGPTRVLARSADPSCDPTERFDHTYDVRSAWPPAAGQPGSEAIPLDDARIVGWAATVASYTPGAAVDEAWQDTDRVLGPAAGTSSDIAALGRGGEIVVTFDPPAADGPGPDLAVFENGFTDTFLELARVAVSSDGVTFAMFDSAARTPEPVGAFGDVDPTAVGGLAGTVRQGFGTPFDLTALRLHPDVRRGVVDLSRITHVRLTDVVGDGSDLDGFDRPIHDPYPTTGSAGFDLDAIAVLAP